MVEDRVHDESLSQLRQELDALERFASPSYPHLAVLALSLIVILSGFAGFTLLPVPAYLLIPFVLIPGWRLFRQEAEWREAHRRITSQIRLIQERAGAS